MILLSCSNCCFNGLQYGSVGLSVGYCVEHRRVLRHADETTCGRHFRKDLPKVVAEGFNQRHRVHYGDDAIYQIRPRREVSDESVYVENESDVLFQDETTSVVIEYGINESKIASLASLRRTAGARAELAMLSLGRSYIRRCSLRGGRWTSGVHLLWWLQSRLDKPPQLEIGDFRLQTLASMERQNELAVWSLVMLRLTVISDIGFSAKEDGHEVGAVSSFVEEAAESASTDLKRLNRWVAKVARPGLSSVLSWEKYSKICTEIGADGAP